MKSTFFGLLVLGITNLTIAQNEVAAVHFTTTSYAPTFVTSNSSLNDAYLINENLNDSAERIKLLRQKIANYNIKASGVYSPNHTSTYDVVLKEGANQIKVVYNNQGEIISGEETFENIRLPYAISNKVAKDNPGWEFYSTWCYITYSKDENMKVEYKIKLKKGNKKRTVKISN